MRKYFLNGAILSAAVSAISTYRTGSSGPRDWRFYLSVVASLLTLAVAMGTVHKESKEMAEEGHGF
ncbi:hypothetical protein [Naasia sp. SYSU D00948]|uniref:hypothetical protein n=1 Tax=Naasia sp. SYSU D00948 TaxID=2817379 RepID=UPI001B3187B6|nr:hypothetical protein [Naasia sp. SYSU D00948]